MENYYKKRHGIARLCGTELKKKQKLNLSQQTVWAGLGCESEAPGKNKGKGSLFDRKSHPAECFREIPISFLRFMKRRRYAGLSESNRAGFGVK